MNRTSPSPSTTFKTMAPTPSPPPFFDWANQSASFDWAKAAAEAGHPIQHSPRKRRGTTKPPTRKESPSFDWALSSPTSVRETLGPPSFDWTNLVKETPVAPRKRVTEPLGSPSFDWAHEARRQKLCKSKSLGHIMDSNKPFDWKATASFRLPPSMPTRRPRRKARRCTSKGDTIPSMPLRRSETR